MTDRSGWSAVWGVSASFLRAVVSGGLGWGLWRAGNEPGVEPLLFVAAVAAVVAVKHGAIGIFWLVRLLLSARRWARYRRQGAKPKADHMADEARLRAKGLM